MAPSPGPGLLYLGRESDQSSLVPRSTNQLNAKRQPVRPRTERQRYRRLTGNVQKWRKRHPLRSGHKRGQGIGIVAFPYRADLWGFHCHSRSQQDVKVTSPRRGNDSTHDLHLGNGLNITNAVGAKRRLPGGTVDALGLPPITKIKIRACRTPNRKKDISCLLRIRPSRARLEDLVPEFLQKLRRIFDQLLKARLHSGIKRRFSGVADSQTAWLTPDLVQETPFG